MKVRMLDSVAGLAMPEYGLDTMFSFAFGEVVELNPELADKWIESGKAEEVLQEEKRRGKKQTSEARNSEDRHEDADLHVGGQHEKEGK